LDRKLVRLIHVADRITSPVVRSFEFERHWATFGSEQGRLIGVD
jgi:hypothetical protein